MNADNSASPLSMTVLIGAASFFVGNAYQAQLPGFARDLVHGRADISYSMLLAPDGSAMGMRTFSGLSVGLLGSRVGIHNSAGLSAAASAALIAVSFAAGYLRRP